MFKKVSAGFIAVAFFASVLFMDVNYNSFSDEVEFSFAGEVFARGGSRGGGGRSFSSGSSRGFKSYSSSSKRSSSSYKSSKPKASKPKPTAKQVAVTKRAQKEKTSKASYIASTSKFKAKSTPASRTQLNSNRRGIADNTRSYDRSTYYSRRDNYYSGWNQPRYVSYGAPSYGLWDTVFLYSMFSMTTNSHMFGYHHRSDPGYSAWRREADKQARENAELRQQLADMERKIAAIDPSTARDANYIPSGMDKDLAYSSEALNVKPVLRLCTGKKNGTYIKLGRAYQKQIPGLDIEIFGTNGSVENIEAMAAGKCDAALVQRDAYWVYTDENPTSALNMERIASPYNEHLHMTCNTNVAKTGSFLWFSSFNAALFTAINTVYTDNVGSGSNVTWSNFVAEQVNYGKIKTGNLTGSEGRTAVRSDDNSCMLRVSALGSPIFNTLRDMKLVEWSDTEMLEVTDPEGKQIYSKATIPSGKYKNLQRGLWGTGWFSSVDTLSVPVDVVVSDAWIKKNSDVYDNTVKAVRTVNASWKLK